MRLFLPRTEREDLGTETVVTQDLALGELQSRARAAPHQGASFIRESTTTEMV
jgi:hypothetical protein